MIQICLTNVQFSVSSSQMVWPPQTETECPLWTNRTTWTHEDELPEDHSHNSRNRVVFMAPHPVAGCPIAPELFMGPGYVHISRHVFSNPKIRHSSYRSKKRNQRWLEFWKPRTPVYCGSHYKHRRFVKISCCGIIVLSIEPAAAYYF